MVSEKKSRPRRSNELGAAGRRAAYNVRKFRERRGLSTSALAERLERLGRPIFATGITKIEAAREEGADGIRRIDVDDLVALALALEVTPNRLLLPGDEGQDAPVTLTPGVSRGWTDAWLWALGELPENLPREGEIDNVGYRTMRRFQEENRPHVSANRELIPEDRKDELVASGVLPALIDALDAAYEAGVSDAQINLLLDRWRGARYLQDLRNSHRAQ